MVVPFVGDEGEVYRKLLWPLPGFYFWVSSLTLATLAVWLGGLSARSYRGAKDAVRTPLALDRQDQLSGTVAPCLGATLQESRDGPDTASASAQKPESACERCRLPTCLKPGCFRLSQDHIDLAISDGDNRIPADVAAAELADLFLVVVHEYPLLTEAVLEVSVVLVPRFVSDRRRVATVCPMRIRNLEERSTHIQSLCYPATGFEQTTQCPPRLLKAWRKRRVVLRVIRGSRGSWNVTDLAVTSVGMTL
jgi:hypothetical protein